MVEVAFKADYGKALPRLVGYSIALHVLVILVVLGVSFIKTEPPTKKIPVFELMKMPSPKRAHHRPAPIPAPAKPQEVPQPKPLPPKIAEAPKDKPVVKPEPPQPEPPPQVQPEDAKETPNPDDFDVDDLGSPNDNSEIVDNDLPQLRAVGDLVMDPLMQDYLERLQRELMSKFNPPDGLTIPNNAKTTVQFTIQRSGMFTNVSLKQSSGNATWDRLAMRAVTLARPMQLPGVYREQYLPLVFDFKQRR